MYIYVFTSSTYNSACGDLEGARVSEATPPPHENSNFLYSRTSKNSKKLASDLMEVLDIHRFPPSPSPGNIFWICACSVL